MGEPSETLDSAMALDETLPVDSEKPDKEDIFTLENDVLHLATILQELPDIKEVLERVGKM